MAKVHEFRLQRTLVVVCTLLILVVVLCLKSFRTPSPKISQRSSSSQQDLKPESLKPIAPKLVTPTTSNPDIEIKQRLNAPVGDRPTFSPRTEIKEALLREEGDTAKFKGYTIVKVGPEDHEDKQESPRIESEWNQEVSFYFENELRLSPEKIRSYREIKAKSFKTYDSKTNELLDEARKTYGEDIVILLEGDLQRLYDQAWDQYDQSLIRLMGRRRFDEFAQFRERYQVEASRHVGWAPGFIR